MSKKNYRSKEFAHLTPQESKLVKKHVANVTAKYQTSGMTLIAQNLKIKNEVQSLLGQDNIHINPLSYAQNIQRLIKRYREEHPVSFASAKANQDSVTKDDINNNKNQSAINEAIDDAVAQKTSDIHIKDGMKIEVVSFPEIPASEPYHVGETTTGNGHKEVYSAGEEAIAQHLKQNHIRFEHEAVLDGLVTEYNNNIQLPCDFVLDINGLLAMIEYNGSQHYNATSDVASYSHTVLNDARRIKFALNEGIPLLVIHHKDTGNMSSIINAFIGDIKRSTKTPTKYTAHTNAYFGEYSNNNVGRHHKVFPPLNYPHVNIDSDLGYIEVSHNQILIWDKDKLDNLLEDNKTLHGRNNALYRQNQEYRSNQLHLTDVLTESLQTIHDLQVSNDELRQQLSEKDE